MTDEELTLIERAADVASKRSAESLDPRLAHWIATTSLKDIPALIAEVRRLRAVALTFEDEADRLGLENKDLHVEVGRLRERDA